MTRHSLRVLTFAGAAAALSLAWLFLSFAGGAPLTLEMDRDLPRTVARGFYPSERHGVETFAWIGDRAELALGGVDRRAPWNCELRFRGGRPDPSTLPAVLVAVDGVTAATDTATNEFTDLEIDVPARPGTSGLTLTIATSNTFVPGPGDSRALGIVIDRLACAPEGSGTRPPVDAMIPAAAAGAAFGAALAVASVPVLAAAGVATLVAAGQGYLLSTGLAPYGAYTTRVLWSGLWIAGLALAFTWILQRLRGEPLSNTAKVVILFSAAALHLKVMGLLHPSKLIIDAVFHAHRLDWVLSGRYLFTQGMPGGVSFPYAIGLYVFTTPWTLLTTDYVSLLRIVVSSVEVVAGALLYVLVVKTRGDRLTGLIAVLLYHCVPMPYGIVGNANMTNVFGQAVALGALVTMALYPRRDRAYLFRAGAFAVCALAFLSHISTFSQLVVTLATLGFLFWWKGGDELRRPGQLVIATAVVAALFAVVVYYGHFMDVYRTAWKARTQAAVAGPAVPGAAGTATPQAPNRKGGGAPMHKRAADAVQLTAAEIGWPVLLLAAVGSWRMWRRREHDRLTFVVVALGFTYLTFLLASTLSRVDAPFERYAAEFVGRVVLATFPAAVVLAAVAVAWAWRGGMVPRLIAAISLLAAASVGARAWAAWFA